MHSDVCNSDTQMLMYPFKLIPNVNQVICERCSSGQREWICCRTTMLPILMELRNQSVSATGIHSLSSYICAHFSTPSFSACPVGRTTNANRRTNEHSCSLFLFLLPHWLICVRVPPWKRLVKAGRNLFRPPRIKLWIFKRSAHSLPCAPLSTVGQNALISLLFNPVLLLLLLTPRLRLLHFDFLKHFLAGRNCANNRKMLFPLLTEWKAYR